MIDLNENRPKSVDAKVLLAALDNQASAAVGLSAEAQAKAANSAIVPYLRFRRQIDEFRSLVSLIEDRLQNMEEERARVLRLAFERLDMLVLTLTVRTARAVFRTILKVGAMPLGARETLAPDLQNLREAGQRLTQPPYAGMLSAQTAQELEDAVAALREIFSRSPDLPDFSHLPGPPPPEGVRRHAGQPAQAARPAAARRPAPRPSLEPPSGNGAAAPEPA